MLLFSKISDTWFFKSCNAIISCILEAKLLLLLELLRKYKSVLGFILTFLGSYLVLFMMYQLYLNYGSSDRFYPDIATHLVALQSESVIAAFGYDVTIEPNRHEPAMNLLHSGQILARVIEGCNAISVMLLFISFVMAFFDGIKKTFLFILGGLALIYAMNVVRIALLTIGIIEYPEYTNMMHGTIFPAVIYGTVFLLWLGWINAYKKGR